VNERHASGFSPDYDAYGYDPYSTGAYQTVGTAFADDADAATGTYTAYIPQQHQPQDYGQGYAYTDPYGYAQQPPRQYPEQQAHDPSATQSWDTGGYPAYDPYAYGPTAAPTAVGTGTYYDTGTYHDLTAGFEQTGVQQAHQPLPDWDSGSYPAYGYATGYATGYGYDAGGDTGGYEQVPDLQDPDVPDALDSTGTLDALDALEGLHDLDDPHGAEILNDLADDRDDVPVRHDYASDGFAPGEPTARSRRRKPAKRSALLTVAVPSVAVMGVAAVGAAAVTGVGMAQDSSSTTQADGAATPGATTATTTQLDRQLAGVSRDAGDFATRASRSQERLDLKERQAAAKKAAAAAAARKEALRPKFVLPVTQKGLSAYFGQAGVNWMALHTGIDFPVQVGTPVMAVTDGTVRTQWNSSYGNMAIVTAPDGTETWYCHLSSTKIRSGKVKAGTVIAYSGNTGNTTGPHLHLEVRPDGGAPIDPLPWLLKHGLDPR
jgi:murein DD-endopeptidase MepM/ murein hydrolase activator NlpD